jgi:hypothetical protein
LQHRTVFMVLNTVFWLGLLALVLTDPFRMALGAGLLALAFGVYLIYGGISSSIAEGMAYPGLIRGLSLVFGLVAVVLGSGVLVGIANSAVLPRRARLQRAAEERLRQITRSGTYLNLSGLGLQEVPPEVWQQTHLTWLDLSDNRLTSLPPQLGNLTQLECLFVGDNRLEALPPEIGALSRLTELDLDGNRLRELPAELARCQRLTFLRIQHNRFTSFPRVILELPDLEVLFLDGNSMGPLPDAIIRQAEAGTLTLSYRPHASRVDWASVFVIVWGFVLPQALSWIVNHWWAWRERRQQAIARREGEVFPIPPLHRRLMLFVLFASLAVSTLMLTSGLNAERTNVSLTTGLGLFLVLSSVIGVALAFLLHNTGMVVLTRDSVRVRRLGRGRALRYADIIELRPQAPPFGLTLAVRGADRTLRIPRRLKALPQIYALLLQRVPPEVRAAALDDAQRAATLDDAQRGAGALVDAETPSGEPAYTFDIARWMWALYIGGVVLLVLIYLGIGLLGLWTGLAQGEIPPLEPDWLRGTLIFFGMISLLFVPAIVFALHSLSTKFGPFKIERPVALELYRDKLRYRFPRSGQWHERSARGLRRISLNPLSTTVRVNVDGARVGQEVTLHMVLLEFDNGARLAIDQERAFQWRQTPERLYAIIRRLYKQ